MNKELEEAIKRALITKHRGTTLISVEILETVLKELKRLQEENNIQRKQLNDAFSNGFIHKDKIREKIEELKMELNNSSETIADCVINLETTMKLENQIYILEELLEGK